MSGPDLLERTRMALAEVGYDPAVLRDTGKGTITWSTDDVPEREMWAAVSIAKGADDRQICWACVQPAIWAGAPAVLDARDACLADRPLVRDCGIDR